MDTLHLTRLVTRYGYPMVLKIIVLPFGEIVLVTHQVAVDLHTALVITLMLHASHLPPFPLLQPLPPLSSRLQLHRNHVLLRVRNVKRTLTVVRRSVERRNAENLSIDVAGFFKCTKILLHFFTWVLKKYVFMTIQMFC